jgi:hypothetical protein
MFRQNRGAAEKQATATMGRGEGGARKRSALAAVAADEAPNEMKPPTLLPPLSHLSEWSIFGTVCIMLEKWLSYTEYYGW